MHYKVVLIGRKESVKGLSQRSTVIVASDTHSPCKIFTGHTHAQCQTIVGPVSAGSTSMDSTNPRSKIFGGWEEFCLLLMCTR